MSDDLWTRQEIESPCVKICVIHPEARLCIGCFRTGEEIQKWSRLTAQERRDIMDVLAERGKTLTKRRGGRDARMQRTRGPEPAVVFAPKED
ncbi:DUF1289 domain-containing protein [Pseudorhodobacter sp.]|uniref:DUF1289 domain-containing protein n=1 Tax=Pseudorhodobacter sp. TaxID=1934400 RepID=UPI002AFFEA72|nr:DUF1289 domain-containing protein [Pseudorhodobacter sp.]